MRFAVLGLAVMLGAVAVAAQAREISPPISSQAWETFKKETYARFGDPEPGDPEYELYQAAVHTPSQARALAVFAQKTGLDPAQAGDDAALIVDAVGYFHTCRETCAFRSGTPLYGEAARLGLSEPSGRLLLDIAKLVEQDDEAEMIRLVWRHPAAASILLDLYGYNGRSYVLAAALLKLPDDPAAPPPFLGGATFSNTPDEVSGLVPAIVEATEARLADSPNAQAWRIALAQWGLDQALAMGLDQEAVSQYLAFPEAIRAALPYAPSGLTGKALCNQAPDSYAFGDHLAAALWQAGHRTEARAVLAHAYPGHWRRNRSDQARFDMISDAVTPAIVDKDLFQLYIVGPAPKGTSKTREGCNDESADRTGWLNLADSQPPAVRHLVSERLSTAGYKDMAAWIDGQKALDDDTRDPAVLAQLADALPAGVKASQASWAARIATARAAEATPADRGGPIHVTVSKRPDIWAEHALPANIKPWMDADKAPGVPKGTKLPVPVDSVLRYEADGKDAAIVYESSEYDLSGEVPAGGLWLALRRAGVWQKPLYLGLQSHFPYVVTAGSRLPMIKDGRLQLEVRVREIDPKTIIFPPVALGYKRQADGFYLEASLDALSADTDKDGLTDIEEARLGLKPDAADSDGDGIADGADPLPLTPYNPKADPRETAVARTILEHLVGHDAGAHIVAPQSPTAGDAQSIMAAMGKPAPVMKRGTIFVVSDKDIFSGILDAPFRLVVYSNADLERLQRTKAPFYPPRVINLFVSLDGADYYVNWSAGWVGGSFLVHCDGTTCTSTSLGDWIT